MEGAPKQFQLLVQISCQSSRWMWRVAYFLICISHQVGIFRINISIARSLLRARLKMDPEGIPGQTRRRLSTTTGEPLPKSASISIAFTTLHIITSRCLRIFFIPSKEWMGFMSVDCPAGSRTPLLWEARLQQIGPQIPITFCESALDLSV
jgi:hypothetical protein